MAQWLHAESQPQLLPPWGPFVSHEPRLEVAVTFSQAYLWQHPVFMQQCCLGSLPASVRETEWEIIWSLRNVRNALSTKVLCFRDGFRLWRFREWMSMSKKKCCIDVKVCIYPREEPGSSLHTLCFCFLLQITVAEPSWLNGRSFI